MLGRSLTGAAGALVLVAAVCAGPAVAAPKPNKPGKPNAPYWSYSYGYVNCFDTGEEVDSGPECSGSGSATRDGTITAQADWSSLPTALAQSGESNAGGGVGRTFRLTAPDDSVTFTTTFVVGVGAIQLERAGTATAYALGYLFVRRPGCTNPCPAERAEVEIARAGLLDGAGKTATAGEYPVSLTLTAPAGDLLPPGDYTVNPVFQVGGFGPRIDGNSAGGSGTVTVRSATVTG